jgi:Cu+-exporting ATPase
MEVDPERAAGKSEYKGQTYYFCASSCKQEFDRDPERYVGTGQSPQQGRGSDGQSHGA